MGDELNPCPFCGSVGRRASNGVDHCVQCTGSECHVIGPWRDSAEEALAAWNRRATELDAAGRDCPCACHRNPNIKHAIPCCTRPPVEPPCPYVVSSREGTSYCSLNGPAVPSGFVPVPREPTEAMLTALLGPMPPFVEYWQEGGRLCCKQESYFDARKRAVAAFAAMLAAAPTKETPHD